MINHIRGIISKKSLDFVVIEACGVGYEVLVSVSTAEKLQSSEKEAKLYIVESVAMYSGGTTLYGFLTEDERDIYMLLKDNISGAGAKKSLDYFDKVSKSLPDFKKAVMNNDITLLSGVFGFTKKTAEKIIAGLKDKIAEIEISGKERWVSKGSSTPQNQAIAALIALGYKENQSREAVNNAIDEIKTDVVEEIIKNALKHI